MSVDRTARLAELSLPDFGTPAETPSLPPALFATRLDRFRARLERRGYDRVVVYADREHSANLSYLTGFDPRFEEAVLIVGVTGEPIILVGNECWGTASSNRGSKPVRYDRFALCSRSA